MSAAALFLFSLESTWQPAFFAWRFTKTSPDLLPLPVMLLNQSSTSATSQPPCIGSEDLR
jgi:hypothetical protein